MKNIKSTLNNLCTGISDIKIYYIYILECDNALLYTGVTTDYKRRFLEHCGKSNVDKGAKFTKSHKPKKIVALWETNGRSNAQKLESRIKKLSKEDKLNLIKNNRCFNAMFGDELDVNLYKKIRASLLTLIV